MYSKGHIIFKDKNRLKILEETYLVKTATGELEWLF